jgi:hypothetical protein
MNSIELAKLVKDMREAQKEYFNPKTRTQTALVNSKNLESRVDKAVYEILNRETQTTLSL